MYSGHQRQLEATVVLVPTLSGQKNACMREAEKRVKQRDIFTVRPLEGPLIVLKAISG
jgi:hypothetical protein